jgi:squalene-hopene/tetraprenyl-beta-curcumene cyclase
VPGAEGDVSVPLQAVAGAAMMRGVTPIPRPSAAADDLARRLARRLLDARVDGHWRGGLSASALSTAVAGLALHRLDAAANAEAAARATTWIAGHANADGGWGDTTDSPSNVSTTLLAWAALAALAPDCPALPRAVSWLTARLGTLDPSDIARAVLDAYGDDRTFSVPILTFCALAGRTGPEPGAWRDVPQLPFELAALPRRFYAAIRLPVVSYALPALIAIGLVRHRRAPSRNPALRALRDALAPGVLRRLESLQPDGGGFLEAAPLTGFVAVGLAGCGLADHPVARRAGQFLRTTQRADGSWPIDTDLALWVTTGAASALAAADPDGTLWPAPERLALRRWLLDRQFTRVHPFTGASPGGWGWTDRPGAVPDADDTAGALLALRGLAPADDGTRRAAAAGVSWLLDLQNRDGGIPTFCRGWGRLPFDRSCPDLTAHALRAFDAWAADLASPLQRRVAASRRAALRFLARAQAEDGTWTPLWFGNQAAPDGANRTYGTALVLRSLQSGAGDPVTIGMRQRATRWLAGAQNADGGWGGGRGLASSVEETALAVAALADEAEDGAVSRGIDWLQATWNAPKPPRPAPIGLYFARLWYAEDLYPLVFSLAAAARARRA